GIHGRRNHDLGRVGHRVRRPLPRIDRRVGKRSAQWKGRKGPTGILRGLTDGRHVDRTTGAFLCVGTVRAHDPQGTQRPQEESGEKQRSPHRCGHHGSTCAEGARKAVFSKHRSVLPKKGEQGHRLRFAQDDAGARRPSSRSRVCQLGVDVSTYSRTVFAVHRKTSWSVPRTAIALHHPLQKRRQFHKTCGQRAEVPHSERSPILFGTHPNGGKSSTPILRKRGLSPKNSGRTGRKKCRLRALRPADHRSWDKEDHTSVPVGVSMKCTTVRNHQDTGPTRSDRETIGQTRKVNDMRPKRPWTNTSCQQSPYDGLLRRSTRT